MCAIVPIQINTGSIVNIAEIKKNDIENAIDASIKCPNILSLILFGSSLEERCTEESDIDIVVVTDVSNSKLFAKKSFKEFKRQIYNVSSVRQAFDLFISREKTL